jgi:hypothetical protein
MALRAQEISQEAGSKIAQAMRDVIGAAAGLTGFVVESARDLVQYMVRRGQMTQEEADRLIREAEEANARRKVAAKPVTAPAAEGAPAKPKKATPKVAKPAARTARSAKTPSAARKKSATGAAQAKSRAKATTAKKKK